MIANGTIKDRAMSMTGASAGVMKYMASLNITSISEMTFAQRVKASTIALKEQALAWLATPMGMATVAITGISLLISGISKFNQHIQETRQELMQVGQQAADTNKQLYDLISQYSKLGKDGQIDLSDQETAKGIQEQIVELVGDQAKNIDLVNGKYDEEIEKLQQIKALGVGDSYNDISRAAKSAEANLRDGYTSKGVGGSDNTIMGGSFQTATESAKIKEVMTKNGFGDFGKEYHDGTYKFQLDTSDPEKMVESYYKAVELASVIARDYGEDIENSEGALYDFYNQLNKFIDNNKEDVEAYSAAIKNLHTMDANADLAEYLKTNDIDSQDAFDSYIEGIKNSTEYSDAYKQVLIDVANDAFPQFSNSAKDAGENANEMTVSIGDLEKASDKIKTLGSAFKELSEDGYITTKTLGEIQTATGLSGDEWEDYKTKLLNAKVGSAEFNQIMSDMTVKILDNAFAGRDLTSVTEDEIEAILRENGVVNASAVAKEYKARATLQAKLAEADYSNGIDAVVSALGSECKALGLTEQEVKDLATMYASAQQAMLDAVETGASARLNILKSELEGITGIAEAYALLGRGYDADGDGVNNYSAEEMDDMSAEDLEKYRADSAKIIAYGNAVEALKKIQEIDIDVPNYSGAGSSSGGSGSDKNEALDNYLDYAESIYKVHQDEVKYINDIEWAYHNLAKTMEEQAEIAEKIEQARRDYAENRIKDLEHENELLEQVGGTEEQRIANLQESQRIRKEEANRYREWMREQLLGMGYTDEAEISRLIENSDFIQEQQSGWWSDQEKILDIYDTLANTMVDDINHQIELNTNNYGEDFDNTSYYKQIQDIAHAEAERLRALDPEKYKEQIQEWQNVWWDAEKSMLDFNESILDDFFSQLNERLDKEYDIRISRLESESSLLSTHFDLVNTIAEEQHNLNKELLEAETIGARMNEQERATLFTKEEHTRLSGKLNDIMLDITDLQSDYQHDLATATEDTIEEITNNYERQYELKMKEYEIVRAELDLMKKKQVLENVENEKSVRTWSGSGWIYTSVLQDVLDAQEEVANAEYELAKAKTEEAQQNAINALDADADALQTEKNKLVTAIDELAEKMTGSGTEITDALETIAKTDLPAFDAIIRSCGDVLKDTFGVSDDTLRSYRDSGEYSLLDEMQENSAKWHDESEDERRDLEADNRRIADILGLDYDESTGRWKKPDGTYAYANGTKNAHKGLGLFDEEGLGSEFILTKDGVLAQFQGGERVFSPEMAQQNYSFAPVISQPDFGRLIPIEDKISNAISNISNAFGDTYMIKDVQLNESEGGTLKGFMDFLKKKI